MGANQGWMPAAICDAFLFKKGVLPHPTGANLAPPRRRYAKLPPAEWWLSHDWRFESPASFEEAAEAAITDSTVAVRRMWCWPRKLIYGQGVFTWDMIVSSKSGEWLLIEVCMLAPRSPDH